MNELIDYLNGIATDADIQGESNSLEKHDKRFHPNGYKEGSSCKFRDNHPELVEKQQKKDNADDLGSTNVSASQTANGNGSQGGNVTAAQKYMNRVNVQKSNAPQDPKKIQMDRLIALHSIWKESGPFNGELAKAQAEDRKMHIKAPIGPVAQKYLHDSASYLGIDVHNQKKMSALRRLMEEMSFERDPNTLYYFADQLFKKTYSSRDEQCKRLALLKKSCGGEWKKAIEEDEKLDSKYGRDVKGPNVRNYIIKACRQLGLDEHRSYNKVRKYINACQRYLDDSEIAEEYDYIFDDVLDDDVAKEHFEKYIGTQTR